MPLGAPMGAIASDRIAAASLADALRDVDRSARFEKLLLRLRRKHAPRSETMMNEDIERCPVLPCDLTQRRQRAQDEIHTGFERRIGAAQGERRLAPQQPDEP